MNKVLKIKNKRTFFILVFVIILTICIFGFFIHKYNSYDKNVYNVTKNSILFGKDNNYIKLDKDGVLKQKIDGNYYLYINNDSDATKYEIGRNAVIYNSDDSYIYLYGKAYEINSSGEVSLVSKETKIAKNQGSKLYKLEDRKYLITDKKIKSANDTLINTSDYLIVELDTQGKANFANNEINFKAIKPIVLEVSSFKFDIANEKLVTSSDVIDLKNVIGSTNKYIKETDKKEDDTVDSSNYYDEYLDNVIKGVNNLTKSARAMNENSKTKINTTNVYYDFDKWIALKKATPLVSSINIDYVVFDPNNQYEEVAIKLIDNSGKVINNSLNKSSTSFNISNLKPDSDYQLLFGYKLKNIDEFIVVDELKIKTLRPNYSITIDKIAEKKVNNNYKYMVYYTLNADENFIFNSAKISYYMNNLDNLVQENNIDSSMLDSEYKYHGVFEIADNTNLASLNILKINNMTYCIDSNDNKCNSVIDLNVENTFSIE